MGSQQVGDQIFELVFNAGELDDGPARRGKHVKFCIQEIRGQDSRHGSESQRVSIMSRIRDSSMKAYAEQSCNG